MSRASPVEFGGFCSSCKADNATPARAGVEFSMECDHDEDEVDEGEDYCSEELICTSCARALAANLLEAADKAEKNVAAGLQYKNDRWQKLGPRKRPASKRKAV